MLDWTREVDAHEAYIEALDFVIKFYKNNSNFRLDVAKSTAKVLGKDTTSSDESESGRQTVFYKIKLLVSQKTFPASEVPCVAAGSVVSRTTQTVSEGYVRGQIQKKLTFECYSLLTKPSV